MFEQARAAKERLQTEVEELTKLVNEGEDSFKQMRLTDKVPPSQSSEDPLHAAIVVQEEKLRLTEAETSPLTLKAPMDGVIRLINKRPGEVVTTGEPIITVNALRADHIVGYMHPPISVEPKVGMTVQVRTRGFNRQASSATILQVGSELEVVPSPTHARGMTKMEERGLPFLVNLPAGLNLRPGELVDLILQARSR